MPTINKSESVLADKKNKIRSICGDIVIMQLTVKSHERSGVCIKIWCVYVFVIDGHSLQRGAAGASSRWLVINVLLPHPI